MAMSKYLANKLIDHIFRTASFSKPTNLYWALFTTDPTITGSGTEVSGGSYARVQLDPLDTNYTATQGGTSGASSGTPSKTTNAVAVTFAAPTADWGTVGWWGLFDAPSGGNLLLEGALLSTQTVRNGDTAPSFPIGSIQETFA